MAVIDEWEIALEDKTKELNSCQLRDNYVKAVYESMSKGAGGGFEF